MSVHLHSIIKIKNKKMKTQSAHINESDIATTGSKFSYQQIMTDWMWTFSFHFSQIKIKSRKKEKNQAATSSCLFIFFF